MKRFVSILAIAFAIAANAANADDTDYLIKLSSIGLKNKAQVLQSFSVFAENGVSVKVSEVTQEWIEVKNVDLSKKQIQDLQKNKNISYIQPNYKIHLINNFKGTKQQIAKIKKLQWDFSNGSLDGSVDPTSILDNPDIPEPVVPQFVGADPLTINQWGMIDNGLGTAWAQAGMAPVVVAVIDTGVDYTHEDLVEMLWRNPFEIPNNNIDDDGNGFIDDTIGWDFASNDNKPYDLTVDMMQLMLGGGNPGHGTHCAGNVGARAGNGRGIAGVAGINNIRIMPLRFLTERGDGTTAGAVQAIHYALNNGAHVLSNSWGSSGENPNDPQNFALREAIALSQAKGSLFIAAAGNGDENGVGYDNDTSPVANFPASYPDDIIVSVAAIDQNNNLGSFSNWGVNTVDIAAPGVKIYSTVPLGRYSDTVIDIPEQQLQVTWDGTSMATPFVAGAAALYWSKHPEVTWKQVKDVLLWTATPLDSLAGKVLSGGKLNVDHYMTY